MGKSTRDPVRHKRTKRRIYLRRKGNRIASLDRFIDTFECVTALQCADLVNKGGPNAPIPGSWSLEENIGAIRLWKLDCHAFLWFVLSRSPEEDLQYISQKPTFALETPEIRTWVRRPAYDPSTALESDTLRVRSGTYFCVTAMNRLAIFGRDRFIYLTQYKPHKLKFYPGEMYYIHKSELKEIFPDLGLTRPMFRNRSYFVIQVLRNDMDNPTELRVYSSTYKPIFRVVLDFPAGYVPPVTDGSWWHDTQFLSSKLRRRLAGKPQPTAHPSLKAA